MRLLAKSNTARRKRPSPRGGGLRSLEVDDKLEFGGLHDRKTRCALTRTSAGIEDDATGPDPNVLGLSGRRATDPRIPLQEAFSSQFFCAALGGTSSRTALARRRLSVAKLDKAWCRAHGRGHRGRTPRSR